MLENIPKISDGAPIFGMNSVDDPKDLKPGECVELVNAKPGTPPEPRPGNLGFLISDSTGFDVTAPCIAMTDLDGITYIVLWVYDDATLMHKLVRIQPEKRSIDVMGSAEGLTDPVFAFEKIHNKLYCFVDQESSEWDDATALTRHKIVTFSSGGQYSVIDVNLREAMVGASVSMVAGATYSATEENKWVGYGFTYIRRTDSDAHDSSGSLIVVETPLPGDSESMEDPETRVAVQIVGPNYKPEISIGDLSDAYNSVIAQGATHIRVFKTEAQSSEENALAATLHFVMDIPVSKLYRKMTIDNLAISSNNVKITTSASHGYSTGDQVDFFDVGGTVELNTGGPYTITKVDSNEFNLDGTENNSYTDYTSGGKVGIAKTINAIDGPAGTGWRRVVVATPGMSWGGSSVYPGYTLGQVLSEWVPESGPITITVNNHGLTTFDTVSFKSLDGPIGKAFPERTVSNVSAPSPITSSNPNIIGRNSVSTLSGPSTERWLAESKTLNERIFTVLVIDANRFELLGEDKKDYQNWGGGSGYLITNIKNVSDVVAEKNRPRFTINNHGLVSGNYAYIEGVNTPTNYNNKQYEVEVIDANTFDLVGESTSGVSAWTGGGTAKLSEQGVVYYDTVSNAAIADESYICTTTDYAIAPPARFARFIKDRLWLFGVTGERMKAFFSEIIGGDGGCPQADAIVYPQKYASFFKYNNAAVCSASAGDVETGIESLGDDIYLFAEDKIFVLFGGDPTLSSPVLISPDIGVMFPSATVKANIPFFGGMCILFLGNKGPGIIKAGGEVLQFTQFKIKELWPDKSVELYGDLVNYKATIKQHCSSIFFDNTWYIMYENSDGVNSCFAYYFDPELRYDQQAPHGAFKIEQLEI